MKDNIIGAIAIVALLGVGYLFVSHGNLASNGASKFGATTATGMLAENYIPYVLYNGGYNSAKDINTSAFLGTTGTFQIASTGTTLQRVNAGDCYIKAYATTIAASSSAIVDCQATATIGSITATISALTGVTSGDTIRATLATTTAAGGGSGGAVSAFGGLVLTGADASSTAGVIQLTLLNMTGGTYTWPLVGSATGTVHYIATK